MHGTMNIKFLIFIHKVPGSKLSWRRCRHSVPCRSRTATISSLHILTNSLFWPIHSTPYSQSYSHRLKRQMNKATHESSSSMTCWMQTYEHSLELSLRVSYLSRDQLWHFHSQTGFAVRVFCSRQFVSENYWTDSDVPAAFSLDFWTKLNLLILYTVQSTSSWS